MRKIKVVHISSFCYGGAGRAAYRIHEALEKRGIDSSLLNIEFSNASEKIYAVNEERLDHFSDDSNFLQRQLNRVKFRLNKHLQIRVKTLREELIASYERIYSHLICDYSSLPFSNYNILENSVVKDADIIHLHWVAGMLDYPSFFTNNKKPVVWTLHDMNPFQGIFHYKEDEVKNNRLTYILNSRIKNIKKNSIQKKGVELTIITPSQWLLKMALKSKIFRNFSGYCIPYCVNTSFFIPNSGKDFKKENNIPEKNLVLLFVSHAVKTYRKGFDLLIAALPLLTHVPLTLLVLGNDDQINKENVDIRYLGEITDNTLLHKYYSASDATIITSREDNLPNVMLESLACGTPVVAFPVGGLLDHIKDYETGILSKEVSSDSLADAIKIFYKNKDKFSTEKICEYAHQNFNEDLIAEKYIKVYNDLLLKT